MIIREMKMIQKLVLTVCLLALPVFAEAQESNDATDTIPTLVVTNKPIAQIAPQTVPASPSSPVVEAKIPETNTKLYTKPVRVPEISAAKVLNPDYFAPVDTLTGQKIVEIRNEMTNLQGQVASVATELQSLEVVGQDIAANYYAAVATINTQLQTGTTPGNPRLKNRLVVAEDALDTLSGNVADLNKMAVKIADLASVANFLQEQARAAYGLSGSVEEDHVQLAQLEDAITNTSVAVERLLNSVNDNITRAAAYMSSERANLRTLALAISNGDLYGKSLANRPFSMTQTSENVNANVAAISPMVQNIGRPSVRRPLMKIRFDRPNINYSQALYMSVNDAMKQYPNTEFDLVAVSPGMGNPAKMVIESTKARRNAEKVLRNMVQIGVDTNRVKLANITEDNIQYNEVHLYIR